MASGFYINKENTETPTLNMTLQQAFESGPSAVHIGAAGAFLIGEIVEIGQLQPEESTHHVLHTSTLYTCGAAASRKKS